MESLIDIVRQGCATADILCCAARSAVEDWSAPEAEPHIRNLLGAAVRGQPEVSMWLTNEPVCLNSLTAEVFYNTILMNPDSVNYCDKYIEFYVQRFMNKGFKYH